MLSFRKMRNQTCVQIGLTVISRGSTGSGIVFSTSVWTLHVEDCVVSGFSVGTPSSAGLTGALAGLTSVLGATILVGTASGPEAWTHRVTALPFCDSHTRGQSSLFTVTHSLASPSVMLSMPGTKNPQV